MATSKGTFELVVPLASGGLAHYERDNDAPGLPWSDPTVFGVGLGVVDAVSIIQSNFSSSGVGPGNLELIARVGNRLAFSWRTDQPPFTWSDPVFFLDGVTGSPSFIQARRYQVLVPPPSPFPLSMPATLSYSLGEGPEKPVSVQRKITWGDIRPALVSASQSVRLGPFHLSTFSDIDRLRSRVQYSIVVSARLPAGFPNNGPGDPDLQFRPVGGTTVAVPIPNEDERDIYVTATLPATFNIVQIEATVGGPVGDALSEHYPKDCSAVHGDPTTDRQCLLIVVVPLALLSPRIVPLAVIYEPPGNCSWAKLAARSWAGTTIRLDHADSNASQTVRGASVWGDPGLDFTSETVSENERWSQITATNLTQYGTVLADQDPTCEQPESRNRVNAGPGRGDLFLLLAYPTMYYWESAGAANIFVSRPPGGTPPPGQRATRIFAAYAWQLADPEYTLEVPLTPTERAAILALDPFTDPSLQGPQAPTSLPRRFVPMGVNFSLEPGVAITEEQSKDQLTAATIRQRMRETSVDTDPGADTDLLTTVVFAAVAYGGGAAAGALASAVSDAIGNAWGDPATQDVTNSIIKAIQKAGIPLFYKPPTTTTTTRLTHTVDHEVTVTDGSNVTQTFRILDKARGFSVAMYYDSLFGTFAFLELKPGT
jgi:hypothetical protein